MHGERLFKSVQLAQFRRAIPPGRWMLALGSAWLTAFCLFSSAIMSTFTTLIIALGLDPLRTALITALLFTASAALVSTLLSRQRLAAIVGAGVAFTVAYILPFSYQEQVPTYDPGGHPESLNTGTLLHTVAIMLAGGLLSAFLGSAIGQALSEVLFDPIWQLVRLIRHTRTDEGTLVSTQKTREPERRHLVWAWMGLCALLGLLFLSGGLVNLLQFSPDIGLHNPPFVAQHGTLIADSMISSALHGQRRSFLVYLPPSYQEPAAQKRRYPTLYLLHGSPGGEYDWSKGGKAVQSANTLIAQGETSELIMVFPDGNGRSGQTSEWGNSFDQKQMMENFVALDLVHYIDQKYRTIPLASYRAIGGLSMGGFGAMNIAVHHPHVFGTVIALGGYYKAEGSIWGGNRNYLRANSPIFALPNSPTARKLRMFLGAATKDQPYYTDTQAFIKDLKALHIHYTFDLEKGHHAWNIWEVQLYHALIWLRWG